MKKIRMKLKPTAERRRYIGYVCHLLDCDQRGNCKLRTVQDTRGEVIPWPRREIVNATLHDVEVLFSG